MRRRRKSKGSDNPGYDVSVDHRFQIDLRGIISLLSDHLYSSPEVYLRELLQNGVDAITARKKIDPSHGGEIRAELILKDDDSPPTLVFTDDGIGLTEPEVHEFLATIGQSSKRGEDVRNDYIGQFGIGLLSCFVVSDEIIVVTKSAKGGPPIEWRGRQDGTYSVRILETDAANGTQVYLRARASAAAFFEPARVQELLRHFGSLLPYPISLTASGETTKINAEPPPFRRTFESAADRRVAMLAYGREVFDIEFFDSIPLTAKEGGVDGVAFVLPFSPNLATKRTHRVYLKNMLLAEGGEDLLPEWAFFVKCVINANALRPTASRESFYEDETLKLTRDRLGKCLRDWLVDLATHDPTRLQRLISIHGLSIKALALHDDEFFRLFARWLPFETSLGVMTLGEHLQSNPVVRYVRTVDHFRQIARVASAQGLSVINGGYTYDSELLERLGQVVGARVEKLDPSEVSHTFDDLTLDERERMHRFVRLADLVLQPFHCAAAVKKFRPEELPTLYGQKSGADFQRTVQRTREITDTLWSSMMDALKDDEASGAELCFNYRNPLVRRLASVQDKEILKLGIEMLYVQALLLGHQPLNAAEMMLLNRGLLGLIEHALPDPHAHDEETDDDDEEEDEDDEETKN